MPFASTGAYLPPTVISGEWEKKIGLISEALESPSLNQVLLFLYRVQVLSQLHIEKNLTLNVHFVNGNSIAVFAKCVLKVWTKLRGRRGLGSLDSGVPPYICYNGNLRRLLFQTIQVDCYSSLQQQTFLNGLQKANEIKPSQS